ncbi:MAG: shikimate dehydrogenase [Candidatus Omnitrophota bacterium]
MKHSSSPQTYGLIGYPVTHSFSKAMHEAAFERLDINARYELFEVKPEELEGFLLNRKDVIGFNITVPHKVRAREILEKKFPKNLAPLDVGSHVWISGAINTVKRMGNGVGYINTDAKGFLSALKEDLGLEHKNIKDKKMLIIGCGGAGRAVVAGLAGRGGSGKIHIYEPNKAAVASAEEQFFKFSYLKEQVRFISPEEIEEVIAKCALLVNATPMGMNEDDGSPIDKKLLHKNLFVYDVVYNRQTQLIEDAKAAGLNAAGGLNMLLYQGVWAFRFWTGEQKPPVEVMREALHKEMEDIKCRKS